MATSSGKQASIMSFFNKAQVSRTNPTPPPPNNRNRQPANALPSNRASTAPLDLSSFAHASSPTNPESKEITTRRHTSAGAPTASLIDDELDDDLNAMMDTCESGLINGALTSAAPTRKRILIADDDDATNVDADGDVDLQSPSSSLVTPSSERRQRRRVDDSDEPDLTPPSMPSLRTPTSSASARSTATDTGLTEFRRQRGASSFLGPADAARFKAENPNIQRGIDRLKDPFSSDSDMLDTAEDSNDMSDDEAAAAKKPATSSAKKDPFGFLLPQNRMDMNKRRPDDPNFDPKTIYISPQQWKDMTPGQQQYWQLKQTSMNYILLYKMGKFYELFDDDAKVGVEQLGLMYMASQERPHCGFPEAAFNKYATQLIQLGYKCKRVEQTETPDQLSERNKNSGKKKDKCVARSVCEVMSHGTLVNGEMIKTDDAQWLLALREHIHPPHERDLSSNATVDARESVRVCAYGVCLVDCGTGRFLVGQFDDDRQRSSLTTLIAQYPPVELVVPLGNLSSVTMQTLRGSLHYKVIQNMNHLVEGQEFYDARSTYEKLTNEGFFQRNNEQRWPEALLSLLDPTFSLAFSALGGAYYYLKASLNADKLFTQGNFRVYEPNTVTQSALVLDGQTLANLEIVRDNEGGDRGSLLRYIDHTVTPFGKRLMKNWLTSPLADIGAINDRLDAIEWLMDDANMEAVNRATDALRLLPDLERLISRIHAQSIKAQTNEVMYTDVEGKQVILFTKVLSAYKLALSIPSLFRSAKGKCLQKIGHHFYDYSTELSPFIHDRLFLFDKAAKNGVIEPVSSNTDDEIFMEWNLAKKRIKDAENDLHDYLNTLRSKLRSSSLEYHHIVNSPWTIQIPTNATQSVPNDWTLISSVKASKRYYTPHLIHTLVPAHQAAKDSLEEAEKDINRHIFAKFDSHYHMWLQAVETLAQLDCLLSLARTSKHGNERTCRPQFISYEENQNEAMLELTQSVHPVLASLQSTSPFIPNDVHIGTDHSAKFLLVSGANMSGKSTLLRQVCCHIILAQLGCYVPAQSMRLTPIDRIFTRIGANDKIMQGQSTVLVESLETANIIRHATNRSLVILDELGRGTSTFDGTAIAYAVTKHLTNKVGCLTLFSTHYHQLMEDFKDDPLISMYHMAADVSADNSADGVKDVTFLYRFSPGVSPESYGMNVARMAMLPESVVTRAQQMSRMFVQLQREQSTAQQSNSKRRVRFQGMIVDRDALIDVLEVISKAPSSPDDIRQAVAKLQETAQLT